MKSSILLNRDPPTWGAAAHLAERLERFCLVGIGHCAEGRCVEPGVAERAHLRLGHDAGCSTLGVPRRAIALTLELWDTVGAASLLLEAMDEAIAVLAETAAWSTPVARECVAYAIRTRITPELAPWPMVRP